MSQLVAAQDEEQAGGERHSLEERQRLAKRVGPLHHRPREERGAQRGDQEGQVERPTLPTGERSTGGGGQTDQGDLLPGVDHGDEPHGLDPRGKEGHGNLRLHQEAPAKPDRAVQDLPLLDGEDVGHLPSQDERPRLDQRSRLRHAHPPGRTRPVHELQRL